MKEYYAGNLTTVEFKEAMATTRGVIVVIGSCEQHGHHLPLDTDNLIGFETAKRVAKACNCLLLPPVNYGQVWSARNFPGTIALKTSTIKQIIFDIVESLERHHAKNIIFMSGHNGNCPTIKEACRELFDEHGWRNIWHVFPSMNKEVLKLLESPIPCNCVHAGELETSMLLAIKPELVQMEKTTKEFPVAPTDLAFRPIPWDEYLESGSFGDASYATSEKGKTILDDMVDSAIKIITELIPNE